MDPIEQITISLFLNSAFHA